VLNFGLDKTFSSVNNAVTVPVNSVTTAIICFS